MYHYIRKAEYGAALKMHDSATIKDLVAARYGELTEGLRQAADYVVQHPVEVATSSLRSVALASGLSPTTFSRLARALGVENHEAIRRICRQSLTSQSTRFSEKARDLHASADGASGLRGLFLQHLERSIDNLNEMFRSLDLERLERVVRTLNDANRVTLLASSTSRDLAKYLEETVGWISSRWRLLDEHDGAAARAIADAGSDDAFVLISKSLFTSAPIRVARLAAERGAYLLVITDSHTCPALPFADDFLVLPEESPHYFPSYVPTVVLFEAMTSMLAAQIGSSAQDRIKDVELINRQIGTYWNQDSSFGSDDTLKPSHKDQDDGSNDK